MKDVSVVYVVDKKRKILDFFPKSGKKFCLEFRLLTDKIKGLIYFVFKIKLTGRKPFRGFNGLGLTSQQGNLMNHEVKTVSMIHYNGTLSSEKVICCARQRVWDL
jgi:hypothetical protein